jgi:putative RecB family exonuclease
MKNGYNIDHLSVSQVNEYLGCSQQYFYHRIAELEPIDTPGALTLGSAIHCAIEHFNVLKSEGVSVGHGELVQIVEKVMTDEVEFRKINFGRSNLDENLSLCPGMLQAFLEGNDKEERVLAVEEKFELNLPGLAVPVQGRVDAVVEDHSGAITIVDYKTAATRPTQIDADHNLQMTLYGIWGKQRWPDRDIHLRMDYLIKSKRNPAFIRFGTARKELHELELTQLFRKVYNHICMLRSEVIDPLPVASWKCASCSYRHACRNQEVMAA